MAANVLLLFAPLLFLLEASSYVDPAAPGSGLLFILSDPVHLIAISDVVAIIGVLVLSSALFVLLLGLFRGDKRVALGAVLAGVACLACLVAWVSLTLYAQGRALGTVGGVDAAAASGGWSLASLALLLAALAYMAFALRADQGTKPLRLASFWWPVYAAVNVLGAAAIAGFFGGDSSDLNAFGLGFALKLTLVPALGVLAYSDLRDRFPRWAHLPIVEPPKERTPRIVRRQLRPRVMQPAPPPPPPEE